MVSCNLNTQLPKLGNGASHTVCVLVTIQKCKILNPTSAFSHHELGSTGNNGNRTANEQGSDY